jgi:hypothetical protein
VFHRAGGTVPLWTWIGGEAATTSATNYRELAAGYEDIAEIRDGLVRTAAYQVVK